jgi:hypothetical protein
MKIKSRVVGNWLVVGIMVLLMQCKSADNPLPSDENEQITRVNLVFTEEGTANEEVFSWSDPDGDGGNPATIDEITLKPNTTYTLWIEVLDETKNPVGDITEEVWEEADEHLFVFTPNPATLLTYEYSDEDDNGFPVGLVGKVKTLDASAGKLQVELRHQPPVNGTPVKNGSPNRGSADIDVTFGVKVQ